MKTIWKKLSAVLVTAVMAAAVVVPAAAANAYTPVAGTTTTFKKYLVADLDAQIPASVFSFTVAAGTAIPAESGKMEVLAGPDANKVTVTPASFAASETLSSTVADGDRDNIIEAGQGYVKKVVTVDLTKVSFDEPGIYRYIITEANTTIPGMNIDPTPARTLDVYVTDNGSGVLAVSSYVLHTGTDAPAAGANNGSGDVATTNAPVADKSDGYTNTYGTHNLWVGKTVTGNQGSRDKYFKIHVEVTGLVDGTKFTVKYDGATTDATYGNADASISANPNAATTCITADVTQPAELTAASGKITQDFYLQHGQHFVICGLPVDAEYTVSEEAEDYKSTSGASSLNFNDRTNGAISTADVKTGFTNTRDGIIPTGILMSVAPVAIVGVVVLAGVVFFAVRSAKRKAEEAAEADAE
ncbi:MAG: hypothetical protein IKE53_03740 [Clostridiales bacterium]|nr:hypothetical protein [Clostridiales bacterium]